MANNESPMVRLTHNEINKKLRFIEEYKAASNPATASKVDANSNVNTKTVSTLGAELWKDCAIQVNRTAMVNKITELFGEEQANKYIEFLEDHLIYKHDESSIAPGLPYTYGPDECVFVKYNDEPLITTFEALYGICEETEKCVDETNGVWVKEPIDLYIADTNGFTPVTHLTKKVRHRKMVHVKTTDGEDLIVTDNHPLIVTDNIESTKEAKDCLFEHQKALFFDYSIDDGITSIETNSFISETNDIKEFDSHYQYKKSNSKHWNGIPKTITLDNHFGYFVGNFIGAGYYKNGKICFDLYKWHNVTSMTSYVFETFGILCDITEENTYNTISISSEVLYNIFTHYFKIEKDKKNVSLPSNIMSTNYEFISGLITGIIDVTNSVTFGNKANIRSYCRGFIEQLAMLFTVLGVEYSVRCTDEEQYDAFQIKFDCSNFNYKANQKPTKYVITSPSSKNIWKSIEVCKTLTEKQTKKMDYIYDITTETHTFICNGLLVHNCVSINMYPFLEHGLTKLGGESKAPKHLESFSGSFINLVFAVSAQYAGAVATPEALLYMHHFCVKDLGENYIETHPEVVASHLQSIVYSINQPAAARGYQAVFWNISLFDRYFYENMFKNFYFPDGENYDYDGFNKLQKFFMEWLRIERTKSLLTFPVLTEASLNYKNPETGEWEPKDKEWNEWCAEQRAKGLSFFSFNSDKVGALASCCVTGDAKVTFMGKDGNAVIKTIEEYVNEKSNNAEVIESKVDETELKTISIDTSDLSDTNFYFGKITGILKKDFYGKLVKVVLSDGTKLSFTPDHIIPVMIDDIFYELTAAELTKAELDKVIPFSMNKKSRFKSAKFDSKLKHTTVYDLQVDKYENFVCGGIIVHNCRLLNELDGNDFSYSLGAGGVATGSTSVITLNLNRLAHEAVIKKLREKGVLHSDKVTE